MLNSFDSATLLRIERVKRKALDNSNKLTHDDATEKQKEALDRRRKLEDYFDNKKLMDLFESV